ncbi:MAG: hypothetical protein ACKVGW_10100 [Verrucomicrobiia bacterium]
MSRAIGTNANYMVTVFAEELNRQGAIYDWQLGWACCLAPETH